MTLLHVPFMQKKTPYYKPQDGENLNLLQNVNKSCSGWQTRLNYSLSEPRLGICMALRYQGTMNMLFKLTNEMETQCSKMQLNWNLFNSGNIIPSRA